MLPPQLLKDAEKFVTILKGEPSLLYAPELKFLKDYLESLGATLPPKPSHSCPSPPLEKEPMDDSAVEPESEESELEFDNTDVWTEDSDDPQPMGDSTIEVTEEMSVLANQKLSEARGKFSDGDFESAVGLFTESIMADPSRSVTFAKRAACYFKLKKPKAAIRDCDKAISLNPDSAAAYQWRGFSKRALGQWEAAYLDLQLSLKLDYSEEAYEAMKAVEPNYQRIHQHKLKWERKYEERKYNELKKNRDARQKAYEESKRQQPPPDFEMPSCGMPGQMPPGMQEMFGNIFSDPEMMAAMQDPELQKAFEQGMSNPEAFSAAAKNPKFANLMNKMKTKMGVPDEKSKATAPGGDDLD